MADVPYWNQADGSNNELAKGGWPEGMDPPDVNDQARSNLGAIRRLYEDPEWRDLLKEGDGFTVAKLSDTSVRVTHNTTPTSAVTKFPVGSRIRISIDGGSAVDGYVASAVFSSPNTDVTVTLDGAAVVPAGANLAQIHWCPELGQAAFHDVGTAAGEIPTIDDLGDAALQDQGSGNGLDADTVDGYEAADLIAQGTAKKANLLVNGRFAWWQRGTSIVQDSNHTWESDNDQYTADQWLLLLESGGSSDVVDLSLETSDVPPNASTAMKLTAASPTAGPNSEQFAVAQIIEHARCAPILGDTCSFSFWAKRNSGNLTKLRAAVVTWNGTPDVVTSEIIAAASGWAGEGSNPSLQTNWTYESAPTTLTLTASWQKFTIEAVNIDTASAANVAVLIWADDKDYVAGDAVFLGKAYLELGDVCTDYPDESPAQELADCQRYFEPSTDPEQRPVVGSGVYNGTLTCRVSGSAHVGWRFKATKFGTPTIYTFNPETGQLNSNWRNTSAASDMTMTVTDVGKNGATFTGTGGAGTDLVKGHAAAEAVL